MIDRAFGALGTTSARADLSSFSDPLPIHPSTPRWNHRALVVASIVSTALLGMSPSRVAATETSEDRMGAPAAEISDEIVISASRVPLEEESIGSSVTVITAADIERHRWITIADALRTVPGLEVSRSGGSGQITSVFIRGGSSSQTLVLLDGMRLNSATSGAFDFADLLLDDVERIEIVRGPQSTLHGSEAMGGVISIFTRKGATDSRLSALAEVGEDSHSRLHASVAGAGGRFDYRLSLTNLDTDGVSAADVRRGNTETDAHENLTSALGLGWNLGDGKGGARIDLDLRHIDGDSEIDGFSFGVGPVDDLDATVAREALFASLRARFESGGRWTQTFRLSATDDRLEGEDATDIFGNYEIESESLQAEWQSDVRFGETHGLSFGLAFEERNGGSVGSFDESAEILSAFVQETFEGERFSFTLGGRYDDHSEFGSETTWRLAGSFRVAEHGRFHGSLGTGFKAPTLNDLFFPFFSNPDLAPETSEAFDIGFEYRWAGDRGLLDLTYFDSEYEDLIAFDFVTFRPENIASASSEGVELVVSRGGDTAGFTLTHTWNETEDGGTGLPLARRPEHRTTLDVYWRATSMLRLAANIVSSRDRIDSDGSRLEDYERIDLVFGFDLERWIGNTELEPYLRVSNVTDEEYSEVGGYGSQGRTALVGLTIRR